MANSQTGQPWWRRWFGSRAERAVAKYVQKIGFRILARNFSCHLGELDLIALDGQCVVFIEVRSTGGADPLPAAASVDDQKQRRLTRLALHYLQSKHLLDHAARFDVVTVAWPEDQRHPTIEHHRQAFEAAGRFQMYN